MSKVNNVDVGRLQQTVAETKVSPDLARRTQRIQGEWLLTDEGPMFRSRVAVAGGEATLEADMPANLGGSGARVGTMYYVYYGLAANFAFFFAAEAALLGIKLERLGVTIEIPMDFTQVYGLGTAPIIQEIRFILSIKSQAPVDKLQAAERLALERCPGVYALTTPLRVTSQLDLEP
ncbi:MAG: OsmC family protein [Chloroflexi bacterium]|nr:OsmC family protein [Chloroflexota bacterium]